MATTSRLAPPAIRPPQIHRLPPAPRRRAPRRSILRFRHQYRRPRQQKRRAKTGGAVQAGPWPAKAECDLGSIQLLATGSTRSAWFTSACHLGPSRIDAAVWDRLGPPYALIVNQCTGNLNSMGLAGAALTGLAASLIMPAASGRHRCFDQISDTPESLQYDMGAQSLCTVAGG
jgi:hypothetical protein